MSAARHMDNAMRYVMAETENMAWLANAGRVLDAKRDEWAREDAENAANEIQQEQAQ